MQDHPSSGEEQPPQRPRTLSPEEAQRRLEETRQRTEQVLARMRAQRGSPRRGMTDVERQALIEELKAQLQRGTSLSGGDEHREVTSDRAPGHAMGMDR